MGLDRVEILLDLERTFQLTIPDADAARLRSPAAVVDYLAQRVGAVPSEGCLTQQTFYRVRRGFAAAVPALAGGLGLDTPLSAVVHKDQWPRVWAAARDAAGTPDWPAQVPWKGWFGFGPATVRDLVAHIALQIARPAPDAPWTRDRVEWTVRAIIVENTGVSATFRARKTFDELRIH